MYHNQFPLPRSTHHLSGPELVQTCPEMCSSKYAKTFLTNSNELQPTYRAAARTEHTRRLQAPLPPTKWLH